MLSTLNELPCKSPDSSNLAKASLQARGSNLRTSTTCQDPKKVDVSQILQSKSFLSGHVRDGTQDFLSSKKVFHPLSFDVKGEISSVGGVPT